MEVRHFERLLRVSAAAATYHVEVAGVFGHIHMLPVGSTLFLSLLTTLGLFPGAGFLFGHVCSVSALVFTVSSPANTEQ